MLARAISLLVLLSSCQLAAHAEELDAKVRADLKQFRTVLFDRDNSFSPEARQRAAGILADLEKRSGDLSYAQLELGLARIVALADNGHTLLLNPRWTEAYNRIPLSFLIAGDRLFVALEIGWRREFIYFFLESPEILHAADLLEDPTKMRLKLVDSSGEPREITIKAKRDLEPLKGLEAYLPPARTLWIARQEGSDDTKPLYLQDPKGLFHYEPMADGRLAYIRMASRRGVRSPPRYPAWATSNRQATSASRSWASPSGIDWSSGPRAAWWSCRTRERRSSMPPNVTTTERAVRRTIVTRPSAGIRSASQAWRPTTSSRRPGKISSMASTRR